jgi:hypothetical protein
VAHVEFQIAVIDAFCYQHVFDLHAPKVRPREKSIIETGFASPADLISDRESFETWSQICLDHLFGRDSRPPQ